MNLEPNAESVDLTGQLAADLESEDKTEAQNSRFKNKHSLDSDEEDNCNAYDLMDEDDIEGQEDETIERDGQTSITPFNMREEMEEGHFDSAGTYIFKKEKEIQDNWMDNINWVKLKEQDGDGEGTGESKPPVDSLGAASSDDEDDVNEIETYQNMIELMKPGETVLKAIKRLGGGKSNASSASQRWAQKRKNKTSVKTSESEKGVDKEAMLKLTELSDVALRHFSTEIYQDTYEKLNFKIQLHSKNQATDKVEQSADDALDMFADEVDAKRRKLTNDSKSEGKTQHIEKNEEVDSKSEKKDIVSSEVKWEYKWEDKSDADVHGPFSSEEMAQWVEDDYFPKGVFVRKVGVDTAPFYSSKRVDFELYT